MEVKLLRYPGIDISEYAARKCTNLEQKCEKHINWKFLDKLFNELKHRSVFRHTTFQFELNFTRDVLQELSRHDVGVVSSVRSTRYTLRPLVKLLEDGDEDKIIKYLEKNTGLSPQLLRRYIPVLDFVLVSHAESTMKEKINALKTVLVEGWASSGVYTFNLQSLENLLRQRLASDALERFRELCFEIWKVLPKGIQWLLRYTYQEATGEELEFNDVQEFVVDGYFEYNTLLVKRLDNSDKDVAEESAKKTAPSKKEK